MQPTCGKLLRDLIDTERMEIENDFRLSHFKLRSFVMWK